MLASRHAPRNSSISEQAPWLLIAATDGDLVEPGAGVEKRVVGRLEPRISRAAGPVAPGEHLGERIGYAVLQPEHLLGVLAELARAQAKRVTVGGFDARAAGRD